MMDKNFTFFDFCVFMLYVFREIADFVKFLFMLSRFCKVLEYIDNLIIEDNKT